MNQSLTKALACAARRAACFVIAAATLSSQTARSAPNYAAAVLAKNPQAFWQLNETGDPTTGTLAAADSSGNGYNGTYGTTSYLLWPAPQPPDYSGFAVGQVALGTWAGDINSVVTLPALNMSSTEVDTTIAMWISPYEQPPADTGLLFDRSGGASTVGFGFQSQNADLGLTTLGYNWNDNNATWGWNPGLYPPLNAWSFVALVVESNRATIYLYYIDPITKELVLSSAVNNVNHSPATWSGVGPRRIGNDPNDVNRTFPGAISGVALYNKALTSDDILELFAAGVGVSGFPPTMTTQPRSQYVLAGSSAQLRAAANGSAPLSYQWKFNGTDVNLLPNSDNFVGANSNVLTIVSMSEAEVGTYQLTVTNPYGQVLSESVTVHLQAPALVGQWLTNSTLADVSGFAPAGTHDGVPVGGMQYVFTNDVPQGKSGQSLLLYAGDTGIAIGNSSTLDTSYVNTFDDRLNNAMTISFWAKGWPGNWNPFVSKWGESGQGWQLRQNGQNNQNPCWTIRGAGGTVTVGAGAWGNPDDLAASMFNFQGDTNNWHFYVGTYDASARVSTLYVDGVLAAERTNVNVYTMTPASFLCIGGRDNGGNSFDNFFTGLIYDVRVYNYALSHADVLDEYGVVPPSFVSQPSSSAVFEGESVVLSATAVGTPPLSYRWQLNGVDVSSLPNSDNYIGADSNVLTILSVTAAEAGAYQLIVSNPYGSASSVVANVTLAEKKMVGRWFDGTPDFEEVSGHRPPGTHDGVLIGGGNYVFTNDVPPGFPPGQSLFLNPGVTPDTAVQIQNSANTDPGYADTFDTEIGRAFTVTFWAKGGLSDAWLPWVSKQGDNGPGWQVRNGGWVSAGTTTPCFTLRGAGGGTLLQGSGPTWNQTGGLEDLLAGTGVGGDVSYYYVNNDWHFYAFTYSASKTTRYIYIDGVLWGATSNHTTYSQAPGSHLVIGGREEGGVPAAAFTTCIIYDLRIFNHDLDQSQIIAMMPDPVITRQPPATVKAYAGNVARISATVTAHATPVTIQWQRDEVDLVDGPAFNGATISGANTPNLLIGNVTPEAAGVYRLVVTNPNGTVISSNTTLTVVPTEPTPEGNLVGAWFTGAASLADASGYAPAGTHDGFGVSGTGDPSTDYTFSDDVPPGWEGQSLVLPGTTAIAISNSSVFEAGYVNTFDDTIANMTVAFWAKGWPSGGWNPFVSKYGENGQGWQLRRNGGANPTWTVRGTGSPNNGDMFPNDVLMGNDGQWHHYAGTFTFDGVSGSSSLYVDGVLVASWSEFAPYVPAWSAYLTIGGRHNPEAAVPEFGAYFAGSIYNVRIYNVALTEAQVNTLAHSELVVPPAVPEFTAAPILSDNKLILQWSGGTLLQSTNVAGPWVPVEATSPYTNDVTTSPQLFFRLSNP